MTRLRLTVGTRTPRWRRLLALLAAAGALAVLVPAGAQASYWFFNGYLPLSDGTRSVHKAHDCCDIWQYNRISWTSGSHVMNNLGIQYNGNWISLQTPDYVYDYEITWRTEYLNGDGINRAGCQIPASWAWYAVWTNCRFGIGP